MRPGQYEERTDPHYRAAPEPPDENPTQLAGAPTLVLGDQVVLGHLVHQGEVLVRIEGHTKRSADADEACSQATGKFLGSATWWVRTGVIAGLVVLMLAAIGFLLMVGASLLLG